MLRTEALKEKTAKPPKLPPRAEGDAELQGEKKKKKTDENKVTSSRGIENCKQLCHLLQNANLVCPLHF